MKGWKIAVKYAEFLITFGLFAMIIPSTIEAAGLTWKYIGLVNGTIGGSEMRIYDFYGSIYEGERGVANTEGPWCGYRNETGTYLKQYDHMTTPMQVQNNLWVLTYYGDVLGQETIEQAAMVPLTAYSDYSVSGGARIDTPKDFFLGFKVDEYEVPDGRSWYGWVRLSIDDQQHMSLLDYGINLDGGPVVVGVVTPEPSAALLVVLGLGILGLRRRGERN